MVFFFSNRRAPAAQPKPATCNQPHRKTHRTKPGNRKTTSKKHTTVQDTIPICAPTLSQHIALAALQHGRQYVRDRVASLAPSRAAVLAALRGPLEAAAAAEGSGLPAVFGGEGAIYLWARLPRAFSEADEQAVAWLVEEHGVCLIPGSACGAPGFVRAAYANLAPAACLEAAARLRRGLEELVAAGSPGALPRRVGGGAGGGRRPGASAAVVEAGKADASALTVEEVEPRR